MNGLNNSIVSFSIQRCKNPIGLVVLVLIMNYYDLTHLAQVD